MSDLQIRDKGDAKLLVDHQGKDAHLCSTALIKLDGVLLELGVLIESVPAKINESIAEVTDKIVLTSGILHEEELEGANEGDDLCKAGCGNGSERIEAGGNVGELKAGVANITRETDSGLSDKVSNDGKHADTSMLDLNVTKTIELLLVSISDQSEGIKEAKRRLGTEFVLEGHLESRGGLASLGRGECGGTGEQGGENS
jgi:hypothetical protein